MQFTVLVGNPRGVIQQHTGGGWGAMGGVGFFGAISAGARVLGWAALKGASFVFRLPETVAACASLAWVATVFRLPMGEAGVAGVVSAFAVMRSLAGVE